MKHKDWKFTGHFLLATSLQYGTASHHEQKLPKACLVGNVGGTGSKELVY